MADLTITYRGRVETKWAILHDSHTAPGQKSMIEWLKVKGRIAGLLSIGYHYVIFEDGELIPCRPVGVQGSHCRGFNHNSVGICLIGGLKVDPDGTETHADTFTPAQKAKVAALMPYLEHLYPGIQLRGHSEMGNHAQRTGPPCPAIDMEKLRVQIRRADHAH